MKNCLILILALLSTNAYSEGSASSVPAAPTMQRGDTIVFVSRSNKVHDEIANKDVTAPERSRFTVLSVEGDKVYFTSQSRKDCKAPFGWVPNWLFNTFGSSDYDGFCSYNNSSPDEVHKNQPYTLSKADLKNVEYVFNHWTSGVLVVPYKYVLSNHDLAKGNFTIGPYFGYTTTWFNTESTIALSAGLANVVVPTTENGVATTTQKQGLSVAIGLLFKPHGISTGFLLGVDQLGQNSQYQNNGKLWAGIYVGSGFTSN